MPRSSILHSVSTIRGRTPECPLAMELARKSIMARVSDSLSGSPTPTQCDRIRLSCNSRICSGGIRTSLSFPTPVLTAYAILFPASCSSTTARARSIAERAAGSRATGRDCSQTSRSSSSVRSLPLMFNGFIGLVVGVVCAAERAHKKPLARLCWRLGLERLFCAQQLGADELLVLEFRGHHHPLVEKIVYELCGELELLCLIGRFVAHVRMPVVEAERDLVLVGGDDETALAAGRRRYLDH